MPEPFMKPLNVKTVSSELRGNGNISPENTGEPSRNIRRSDGHPTWSFPGRGEVIEVE